MQVLLTPTTHNTQPYQQTVLVQPVDDGIEIFIINQQTADRSLTCAEVLILVTAHLLQAQLQLSTQLCRVVNNTTMALKNIVGNSEYHL